MRLSLPETLTLRAVLSLAAKVAAASAFLEDGTFRYCFRKTEDGYLYCEGVRVSVVVECDGGFFEHKVQNDEARCSSRLLTDIEEKTLEEESLECYFRGHCRTDTFFNSLSAFSFHLHQIVAIIILFNVIIVDVLLLIWKLVSKL